METYTGPWIPIEIVWDGGTPPTGGTFNLAAFLPMPPWDGPPLPSFIGLFWPWVTTPT
jgi:hypothetical protein